MHILDAARPGNKLNAVAKLNVVGCERKPPAAALALSASSASRGDRPSCGAFVRLLCFGGRAPRLPSAFLNVLPNQATDDL
jgi:hypothetical protein